MSVLLSGLIIFDSRLSTLNFWYFEQTVVEFERFFTAKEYDSFKWPSAQVIRERCEHFIEPEAIDHFCDLVAKLIRGPEVPLMAVDFAEHLLKTHAFFSPLMSNVHVSRPHVPDDCLTSIADQMPHEFVSIADELRGSPDAIETFGTMPGVERTNNSTFQRFLAKLRKLPADDVSETLSVLEFMLKEVQNSSSQQLSEKVNLNVFEVFIQKLHQCNAAVARRILEFIFQIMDLSASERHIFMHMAHPESTYGVSVLEYLVAFASKEHGAAAAMIGDAETVLELKTSALECIRKIVSSSIPYNSLSDFATSGCYGNLKMQSMLTSKVLDSILRALRWPPSQARPRSALEVFFGKDEDAEAFFVGQHEVLRSMIRDDVAVNEFRRLRKQ